MHIYSWINLNLNVSMEIQQLQPLNSFHGVWGLGSYLVRAKLYSLETPVESFKCSGKRCQVSMNVTEANVFSSSVDNKEHIMNDSCNCNSRCVISGLHPD